MKTASLVLGIIGGVLAIIFGIIFIISGIAVNSLFGSADALADTMGELSEQMEAEGWTVEDSDVDMSGYDAAVGAGLTTIYVVGALSIVGAILGIVGGAMAKKKNVLAGILMLVAAIPSFFTGLGIIASILFIIGGILALIPDKSAPVATV